MHEYLRKPAPYAHDDAEGNGFRSGRIRLLDQWLRFPHPVRSTFYESPHDEVKELYVSDVSISGGDEKNLQSMISLTVSAISMKGVRMKTVARALPKRSMTW